MKSQQNPINARPRRGPQLPAAAEDVALAVEEHLIWRGEDALRAAGGGVRRGFDRVLWPLQRGLLWPLQDRLRGLEGPRRAVAVATVLLLAAAAGVGGLLLAASGGAGATSATRVADAQATHAPAPAPTPARKAAAPTLHGAAPVFKPVPGGEASVSSAKGVAKPSSGANPASETAASTSAATGRISSSPSASSSSARTSTATVSGPPAGPAAIAVAREFAAAFVVYETGGTEAKVRTAFHATSTRELARSLLRRPPKQPATVKVPKAKVVNVVAAPSRGTVYPVSVSLLRVGVTSELRLELENVDKGGWQVVDVLG